MRLIANSMRTSTGEHFHMKHQAFFIDVKSGTGMAEWRAPGQGVDFRVELGLERSAGKGCAVDLCVRRTHLCTLVESDNRLAAYGLPHERCFTPAGTQADIRVMGVGVTTSHPGNTRRAR